jgi:hypothetical protein
MLKEAKYMQRWLKSLRIVLVSFLLIGLLAGCTYLRNRGNDALDIFDLGLTVSKKPQFGLYADWFNLTTLGFSHIDGWLLGWGMRHAGAPTYQEHAWGVLLWGSEKIGIGPFNPEDPHQATSSYTGSKDECPRYDAGIIGLFAGNNHPPLIQDFECNKGFHLAFIGVYNTCRPIDLIDFILGWTTLDIMGDDNIAP